MRQTIRHKAALYTLKRLYARLAAKAITPRDDSPKIRDDLEHVAAVMLMLDPQLDLTSVKPRRLNKSNPWFRRGECFRAALDVLRDADRPLTTRELAQGVFRLISVEPSRAELRGMCAALLPTLKRQHTIIEKIATDAEAKWALRR